MIEVLMGHSIQETSPKSAIGPYQKICLSVDELDQKLQPFKDYEPIFPESMEQVPKEKKACLLTLDDGYRDNMEVLLPYLEKHQIPALIFIVTEFIEGNVKPYEQLLAEMITYHREVRCWKNHHFDTSDEERKKRVYKSLRSILKPKSHAKRMKAIKSMLKVNGWDESDMALPLPFLNKNELRELADHPLIRIGAHTKNHIVLRKRPPWELKKEIEGSKKKLESLIGKNVFYFAYPYGANDPISRWVTKRSNFSAAFGTEPDTVETFQDVDHWRIPRRDLNAT